MKRWFFFAGWYSVFVTGNFRGEEWEGPVLRTAPERELDVADFARVRLGIPERGSVD